MDKIFGINFYSFSLERPEISHAKTKKIHNLYLSNKNGHHNIAPSGNSLTKRSILANLAVNVT